MEKKQFEAPEVKVLEIRPRTVITASECPLDCYGDTPCPDDGVCPHDACVWEEIID